MTLWDGPPVRNVDGHIVCPWSCGRPPMSTRQPECFMHWSRHQNGWTGEQMFRPCANIDGRSYDVIDAMADAGVTREALAAELERTHRPDFGLLIRVAVDSGRS